MTTDTGVWLSLRYDLRAPSFGAPAAALYRAALDQCAWAEDHGFAMVTLSEHHGADDGYCPSVVVMAAAVAGRTRSMRVLIAALCVAVAREHGSLMLHPLMGGLDPDLAWESLELIASKVIPRLGAPG